MNVTAELLDTFEFRKKGRGYDADQVDELIARVRSTLGDLEARLADATSRAEAAEARATDAEARSRTSSESDETIQRTLLLAQRTADAAVQEAEETAAKKVADAEIEARRLVEEADEARARALANAEEEVRRSVDDSRTRLTQEISALEQIRNTLMTDVEGLEEHIDLERSRLRASSDALTDILSRSDRLGQVELPELSDVDASVAASGAEQVLDADAALASEPAPVGGVDETAPVPAAAPEPDGLDWSTGGEGAADPDPDPAGGSSLPTRGEPPTDDVETIDAPPPPPPPPAAFDDDAIEGFEEPPPPPPPPVGDEAPVGGVDAPDAAPEDPEPSPEGFGGLTGDLDPDNPEDNAWLAELTDDDSESAGAGDSGRRRFGRRG